MTQAVQQPPYSPLEGESKCSFSVSVGGQLTAHSPSRIASHTPHQIVRAIWLPLKGGAGRHDQAFAD